MVFVADTIFMPDAGTAGADFPGGDAHTLYASIGILPGLPANSQIFICHDYPRDGREARYVTSVAEQRESNMHVRDGISEDEFVSMRTAHDATLDMPLLLPPVEKTEFIISKHPSICFNKAGTFNLGEENVYN